MSPDSDNSAWKAKNLTSIHERLKELYEAKPFEQVLPGELQGVFIRKLEQTIEMYCFDNESKQLSSIMSRIDLETPLCLLGHYTQVMFLSAFWRSRSPQSVYMAGYGGGRIAMLLQHYFHNIQIDGTDIDPNVLASAQVFFGMDKKDMSNIHLGDSREDLASRNTTYDILMLDVFSGGGEHVNHLATKEFFELCKSKLADDGILVANLVEKDPLMNAKIAAIIDEFQHISVWEHNGANVVFANDHAIDLDVITHRIKGFTKQEKPSFPTVENMTMIKPYNKQNKAKALRDSEL